jgi:lipoprotein-anchoring transpeptidase ErfK/SrfK
VKPSFLLFLTTLVSITFNTVASAATVDKPTEIPSNIAALGQQYGKMVWVDTKRQRMILVNEKGGCGGDLGGVERCSFQITTGKKGHQTPTGLFTVQFKQMNVTLRGTEKDGRPYSAFVKYWMPFTGTAYKDSPNKAGLNIGSNSYGLHDATWRSNYGNSNYLSNGSHGCVNMERSEAALIYKYWVNKGTKVLVTY